MHFVNIFTETFISCDSVNCSSIFFQVSTKLHLSQEDVWPILNRNEQSLVFGCSPPQVSALISSKCVSCCVSLKGDADLQICSRLSPSHSIFIPIPNSPLLRTP
ncbi:hypothetical protein GOODEAATRI_024824 [Goodea atripinnis]|uniref:Uncharacterized protein n=1 Tax=Goodea atripinnis TaxID=208336 RepID=A0ABV0NXF9_9TELE